MKTDLIISSISPYCHKIKLCGSSRRGKPNPGDIDIVCIPSNRAGINSWINNNADKINWRGDRKVQFIYQGTKVDLFMVNEKEWAASILAWTGPAMFNIVCRSKAKAKGLKLNDYGLWKRDKEVLVAWGSELEILAMIGMAEYLSPKERERRFG